MRFGMMVLQYFLNVFILFSTVIFCMYDSKRFRILDDIIQTRFSGISAAQEPDQSNFKESRNR